MPSTVTNGRLRKERQKKRWNNDKKKTLAGWVLVEGQVDEAEHPLAGRRVHGGAHHLRNGGRRRHAVDGRLQRAADQREDRRRSLLPHYAFPKMIIIIIMRETNQTKGQLVTRPTSTAHSNQRYIRGNRQCLKCCHSTYGVDCGDIP